MLSLDSSLCLSQEIELEGTKYYGHEVDENILSPPVSPVSSFQSYSRTAGTAELEDELVRTIVHGVRHSFETLDLSLSRFAAKIMKAGLSKVKT